MNRLRLLGSTAIAITALAGTTQVAIPQALGGPSFIGFARAGQAWEFRIDLRWSLIDAEPVNCVRFTSASAAGIDIGWEQFMMNCGRTRYGPFVATDADFGPVRQSNAAITLYPPEQPINPLVACAYMEQFTLVATATATSISDCTSGSVLAEHGFIVGTNAEVCNGLNIFDNLMVLTDVGAASGFFADSLTFLGSQPKLVITASTDIRMGYVSCYNTHPPVGGSFRRAVLIHYRGLSGNTEMFSGAGLAIVDRIDGVDQEPELYGLFEGGLPTTNAPLQIEIPIPQGAASEPFSFHISGSTSDTFNAGDLNGDGVLTSADAELLVSLIGTSWNDDAYQLAGDMNLDGVINDVDAAILYHRCRSCFSPCNPADIAFSDGSGAPDGQLDNGDLNLFIASFFGGTPAGYPANPADIADSSGNPGPDGQVDNGDLTLFVTAYFDGC